MTDQSHWTELSIFKGIDLHDSFVLGWRLEGGVLAFTIEASIWPDSSYYQPSKNGEYTCYRKATLAFIGADEISGVRPIEAVQPTYDLDGSTDYGNIESLIQLANTFRIDGEFGSVQIIGGELLFEIHPDTGPSSMSLVDR